MRESEVQAGHVVVWVCVVNERGKDLRPLVGQAGHAPSALASAVSASEAWLCVDETSGHPLPNLS